VELLENQAADKVDPATCDGSNPTVRRRRPLWPPSGTGDRSVRLSAAPAQAVCATAWYQPVAQGRL